MAEKDWKGAKEDIEQGLAVINRFGIPTVAWRLHATCSELYRHLKDDAAAEAGRARAESVILSLANSLDTDEPLRRSFLAAGAIRRILRTSALGKRTHGPS